MDIKELKQELQSHENVNKKHQMEAYMRNQFTFYGIQATERRNIAKPYLYTYTTKDAIPWDVVNQLWQDDHRECQYIALDLLKRLNKQLTYDDINHLQELSLTKSWWDTIDILDRLIGNIGLIDSRVDQLMIDWSIDDNMWLRRIAIDHQNGRKEKTNSQLLDQIIQNNFGSNEFFINKAIGWSLREYAKVNPEWVKTFIQQHKQKMHPLSIKEALKHIK